MLDLQDPRWPELEGGYRVAYDPRAALAALQHGDAAAAWAELWQELHHQGDIGTVAYAAIPHLVRIHRARGEPDWNTYALLSCVELARDDPRNPPLPDWLADGYAEAWREVVPLALADLARSEAKELAQGALAVVAIARGLRRAGELLSEFTDDELEELLQLYRDGD